jgi:hypothetical protein
MLDHLSHNEVTSRNTLSKGCYKYANKNGNRVAPSDNPNTKDPNPVKWRSQEVPSLHANSIWHSTPQNQD